MPPITQSSFVAGEVSPDLYGRTDLPWYRHAAKTMRNFVVVPTGVSKNRPGTKLVLETKDSTKRARLIPFQFSSTQAYAIEVGNKYMRFHTLGATVLKAAVPYEIVSPYATADLPLVKFAQLNDVMTLVHPKYPPYELKRLAEDDWTLAPLSVLNEVQPPGTPSHSNVWDPADPTHPLSEWDWVVTSVDGNNFESLPSAPFQSAVAVVYPDQTFTQLTYAAPTTGPTPVRYNIYRGRSGIYGYVGSSEDTVFVDRGGPPDLSDAPPQARDPFLVLGPATTQQLFAVAVGNTATKTQANEAYLDKYTMTWDISGLETSADSIAFEVRARPAGGGAWTVVTTIGPFYGHDGPGPDPNRSGSREIIMDALAAGSEFNINETIETGTGAVALDQVSWTDQSIVPNPQDPSYPSAVCYFEQRQVFGGFTLNGQQLEFTQTGDFNNFDRSEPLRDDDGMTLVLASKQLDAIHSLVPLRALIAMTAGAEWVVRGVNGEALSPYNFDMKPKASEGSGNVDPLAVGSSVIFLTNQEREVRQFTPDLSEEEASRSLSVRSAHLFEPSPVVEWAYAKSPHGIVWAVRSDGTLVGLTMSQEHQVQAWHRHDTDGLFESVCAIREQVTSGQNTIDETAVYVTVNRTIGGVTKRYVERFATRYFASIEDSVFLDSCLTYDGRNTAIGKASTSIKATGGVLWLADENITLEANLAGAFTAADVGQRFELVAPTGETARFHVDSYTDDQNVAAHIVEATPAALQDVFTATWGRAVKTFAGLSHLEGKSVGVLVDGGAHARVTVASGAVVLSQYGVRAAVGLPYQSDLTSLPLDSSRDGGRLRSSEKAITRVLVEVDNWRGLYAGVEGETLQEIDQSMTLGSPTAPANSLVEIRPEGGLAKLVTVALQQRDPLPVTVLKVIADVEASG